MRIEKNARNIRELVVFRLGISISIRCWGLCEKIKDISILDEKKKPYSKHYN